MELFHSVSLSGKNPRPIFLRVDDIQAVVPDDDGPGCSVVMRGSSADLYLAESAADVVKACGFQVTS